MPKERYGSIAIRLDQRKMLSQIKICKSKNRRILKFKTSKSFQASIWKSIDLGKNIKGRKSSITKKSRIFEKTLIYIISQNR